MNGNLINNNQNDEGNYLQMPSQLSHPSHVSQPGIEILTSILIRTFVGKDVSGHLWSEYNR
jgi:hypothetical protein